MREKAKAQAGMLYDANFDEELLKERAAAKELLYEINHLRPSKQSDKERLYKKLIGKLGERFLMAIISKLVMIFMQMSTLSFLMVPKLKSAIMCLLHRMLAYTQPVTR